MNEPRFSANSYAHFMNKNIVQLKEIPMLLSFFKNAFLLTMKTKKNLAFILMLLLALAACKPANQMITVVPIDGRSSAPAGRSVFYALPRTAITIDVSIDRIQQVPGPFAEYAGRFLGLGNIIRTNTTTYRIAEIQINSFSEPDPQQLYFVSIPPEKLMSNTFFISLTESGLLQSINMPFDNREIQTGGNVTTPLGTPGNVFTFNYFIDFNLQERVDTVLERVQIDTLVVTRQTLRRTMVEKPIETRAREVAEHILLIRNKRFAIITGYAEIPYSREALEFMYSELGKQEDEYLQLFTGLTSANQIRYRFTFVPDQATSNQPHTLFFFSEREGVVPTMRRDAEPVVLTTERNQLTRRADLFGLNAPTATESETGVLFYRIPEHAVVTILSGNTPRASSRMLINQFGIVTAIPLHGQGVMFYPNTGSIKSMGATEANQ